MKELNSLGLSIARTAYIDSPNKIESLCTELLKLLDKVSVTDYPITHYFLFWTIKDAKESEFNHAHDPLQQAQEVLVSSQQGCMSPSWAFKDSSSSREQRASKQTK